MDNCIIRSGVFEKTSSEFVRRFLKKGQIVLDIGANFGYYSVISSKKVGESGLVYAFEPTEYYRKVLLRNISQNGIKNCKVIPYGLSDKKVSNYANEIVH